MNTVATSQYRAAFKARRDASYYINRELGAIMEGPLRGILAGAAAWKFGGGCISTILIFIIVFWLLGFVNC
ncbi:MAG: hypothetical protein ACRD8U_06680 [Pyrinomonadaceae bacterium]